MGGAFLYLTLLSMKNRLRRRFTRLREPRYAIGLAVGMLYLYGTIFRSFGAHGRGGAPAPGMLLSLIAQPMQLVGAAILFVFVALAWLWPTSQRGITFTKAEIQFLFTAPVSRRQLLHYKLLRTQLAALFGSMVMAVFIRPASLAAAPMLVVGLWILFTTLSLHLTGVALRRQSLAQHGKSGLARHGLPLLILGGAIVILATTIVRDWYVLSTMATSTGLFDELQRLGSTGPAAIVLWPFRAIARLPLSLTRREFASALPAAVGILGLNYVWAMRSDAAFEEASAAQAEKVAQLKTAPRRGPRKAGPTPFTLKLEGRPEFAILWKNLIMLGRFASLRTVLRLLPAVLAVGFALHNGRESRVAETLAMVSLFAFAATLLFGAQIMRNDLRQDLANLQILKTWPIRGAALLRGEILSPGVALVALAWLFLAVAAVMIGDIDINGTTLNAAERLSYTLAAALMAPGFIFAQLVVQNSVAVLFPGWINVGATRQRGIDAMGQRLLMMAGVLLTLVVSLVPAVVVAGIVGGVIFWTTGVVPIVVPAAVAGVTMIIESAVVIELLGGVLDRTDVSAIEAVES